MANNILPPGDVAQATASELAPKGRNFWQKLNIGMGRVETFVDNLKKPLQVKTNNAIDDASMKKLFTYGIVAVVVVLALKKLKIF